MKNTVRRINLEGELGEKFGKVWHLNVKSPAEAIRAIEVQRKGFRKYFIDTGEKGIGYEVIVGDQGIQQEEALLYPTPMRDDYTFIPVPQGGKSRGMGMILMGAVLFIASGGASAVFNAAQSAIAAGGVEGMMFSDFIAIQMAEMSMIQTSAMMMGGALMMGGVAQLLAPTIEDSAGNDEQSYLFDGAQNSVKQGTPVPVLYGRLTVGGAVISASIKSNAETSRVPGIPVSNGRQFVYGLDAEPGWPGVPGGKGQTMPGMTQIE